MSQLEPIGPGGAGGEPWRRSEGRRQDGGPLRVALLLRDGADAAREAARASARLEIVPTDTDLASLAEGSPLFSMADALVVEIVAGDAQDMESFDRLVHLAGAEIAVIAAVRDLGVQQTRALLRAGASDVLALPFATDELEQAVEPARRPARPSTRAAPAAPQKRGRIISFLGALGGAGSTSIATQAGIMWAADARVLLLDLDIQFGNAGLYLDIRPSFTLAHLVEDSERLDGELLKSVAIRHSSGLNLVASPTDMVPLDLLSAEFVDRILRIAAQAYDVVLVDLPMAWTEWSLRVLERSDLTCLVTNLSVPGIYQARRQLEIIEANGLMDRLRIVANRVPSKLFGKTDLSETEAALGRRIHFTVCNDYPTVSAANDQGIAIAQVGGGSRLMKDMKALAVALSEVDAREGLVVA